MPMDRFIFGFGAVAMMALGLCAVVWPAKVIQMSRDDDDKRPLTAGEILRMRVVGGILVVSGGYGLWSIMTGQPGAEFFPA